MNHTGQSDAELLAGILRPEDAQESYITSNNQYCWYRWIAAILQPKIIGEIGVHCGYSLWAMRKGAPSATLFGWDNESIVAGCLGYVRSRLNCALLFNLDTQKMSGLMNSAGFDLFHVDGDHTPEGCGRDMMLAWDALRHGGTMIVDDVDYMNLRPVVENFAKEHGHEWTYLPTFRGMGVIKK